MSVVPDLMSFRRSCESESSAMDALVRFFPLEEATTVFDVLSEEGASSFAEVCSFKDLKFPISTGGADSLVDFLAGLHATSSSSIFLVDDFFVGLYAESSSDNLDQTDEGRQDRTSP